MKSNDISTYKKIISEYADKINFYMKENKQLRNEIEDVKMTLKINKDLLFTYITSNSAKSEEIKIFNNYLNENKKYLESNEKLIDEKRQLELKILTFQNLFEEFSLKRSEELEKSKEEIFLLKNKLLEKESEIKLIKKDSIKGHSTFNKKDFFLYEPTKNTLELNNELTATRELLSKISKLLNAEKIKSEKLEKILREKEKRTEKEIINIDDSCVLESIQKNKLNFKNLNESLLSEDDMQVSDIDDDCLNLDSPSLKFPDKIKSNVSVYNEKITPYKKNGHNSIQEGIPKLDFNLIKSNYQSCADVKIKKNNNPFKPEDQLKKTVDKLNADLKESKEKLNTVKNKIEKFKNAYLELKEKFKTSEKNLKSANYRIENLENQLKKLNALTSTEDRSFRKPVENNSMVKILT
jgi:hypothetical protein